MITIKTLEEIEQLKIGGKILAKILKNLKKEARPGISTGYLNDLAEKWIKENNCEPSFKNYKASHSDKIYPKALCASLNEVIVHQVPDYEIILKDGDVLKLDLGLWYLAKSKKLCVDAAITVAIGKVSKEIKRMIEVTEKSLSLAIKEIKPGNHLGDIGFIIQNYIKLKGFEVIRELVGHGVGYNVHEDPEIFNYGSKGEGYVLRPGMVLAIEPMVSMGDWRITKYKDGFGYKTADDSLSAHFEHTVAITDKGCEILTL